MVGALLGLRQGADASVSEHQDAVGKVEQQVGVVGRHEDAQSASAFVLQHLQDVAGSFAVEADGGLVHHQHFGFPGQRERQQPPAGLTAGQLVRVVAGQLGVEPDSS